MICGWMIILAWQLPWKLARQSFPCLCLTLPCTHILSGFPMALKVCSFTCLLCNCAVLYMYCCACHGDDPNSPSSLSFWVHTFTEAVCVRWEDGSSFAMDAHLSVKQMTYGIDLIAHAPPPPPPPRTPCRPAPPRYIGVMYDSACNDAYSPL